MNGTAGFWTVAPYAPLVTLGAAAISAVMIVLLRPVLRRYALARVNSRSSHRQPTPQGGGIAVIAATLAVVLLCAPVMAGFEARPPGQLFPVLAAAVLVALVGGIDDLHGLPVGVRLPLQALAVIMVAASLPAEARVLSQIPIWVERTLLVVGGVYFINVVNFMDGLDWITVAEVVPVTVGLLFIGVLGGLPAHGVLVALALLGAVIGFAPFNRPVAELFLGDVGSLPIGLLLGWLLFLVAAEGHLAAAVLLPLYYIADATITLFRRLLGRERVWQAHRSHFYQRATDRGLSVIEVDARVFGVNIGLVALSTLSVAAATPSLDIAALALGAALVGWLLVTLAKGKPSVSAR